MKQKFVKKNLHISAQTKTKSEEYLKKMLLQQKRNSQKPKCWRMMITRCVVRYSTYK